MCGKRRLSALAEKLGELTPTIIASSDMRQDYKRVQGLRRPSRRLRGGWTEELDLVLKNGPQTDEILSAHSVMMRA